MTEEAAGRKKECGQAEIHPTLMKSRLTRSATVRRYIYIEREEKGGSTRLRNRSTDYAPQRERVGLETLSTCREEATFAHLSRLCHILTRHSLVSSDNFRSRERVILKTSCEQVTQEPRI